MNDIIDFLGGLVARFSSRSFVVTFVVIYLIATRPDMSIEQVLALLGAVGFITVRAVAEDKMDGAMHVDIVETDESVNNTK